MHTTNSACFLLRMTEEHSLTHAGVYNFCDSTQWFIENICSQISNWVEASLPPSIDHNIGKISYMSVLLETYWAEIEIQ